MATPSSGATQLRWAASLCRFVQNCALLVAAEMEIHQGDAQHPAGVQRSHTETAEISLTCYPLTAYSRNPIRPHFTVINARAFGGAAIEMIIAM